MTEERTKKITPNNARSANIWVSGHKTLVTADLYGVDPVHPLAVAAFHAYRVGSLRCIERLATRSVKQRTQIPSAIPIAIKAKVPAEFAGRPS